MIHFVGAGPGAPDLITLRGARLLEEADVVIYAGSLVNPALLDLCSEGCVVYDSSGMTLEEVVEVMRESDQEGKNCVRLHTGDPSLYGAHCEQMDELDRLDALVIRPPEPLGIHRTERDPDELERVYQIGRREALRQLSCVRGFLNR